MVKKPGLGRGLDVLLSSSRVAVETVTDKAALKWLPVDRLTVSPYQPRRHIEPDALKELADSIRVQGLIQPLIVRALSAGGYELIAGERRWRAAQLVGMKEVPSVVRNISDQAAAALALIENIQREDLNAIEESTALRRLIDEFGLTHQQTADAVGRSRTTVTNLLRLLELSAEVKELLLERKLDMGHARCLLRLSNENVQREVAQQVIRRELSVRQTEQLVKQLLDKRTKPLEPIVRRLPEVSAMEKQLTQQLGSNVTIRYNTSGKGKMIIEYSTLDQLDAIIRQIQ